MLKSFSFIICAATSETRERDGSIIGKVLLDADLFEDIRKGVPDLIETGQLEHAEEIDHIQGNRKGEFAGKSKYHAEVILLRKSGTFA